MGSGPAPEVEVSHCTRGIGNADEILHAAKLSPFHMTSSITARL